MLPSPTSTSSSTPVSPAATLVNGISPPKYSWFRRYTLLAIFCLAQFLDAFNNSALFSAIPSLINDLGITQSESTWIMSAFQLTFAAFLLISGRISDIYNPKYAFIAGVVGLGIISVGAGFVKDKILLIVLRAMCGIAASMTIPSAITLLVNLFTDPIEQARALGVFGGCGAIGNVLGLIIGAMFVQYANWSWVFWFVAIVAVPIGGVCTVLVPPQRRIVDLSKPQIARWKSLDLVGVTILTSALILFIFAVTSGSTDGWGSATVLAPLIISIIGVAAFFYYETKIPADVAAVPPRTWFLPNFSVIIAVALLPYFWWTTIFTMFTTYWQDVFHWSAISVALHMLPIGIVAFSISFSGPIARVVSPKWILLFAEVVVAIATILLHFADRPSRYWSYVVPAFILGSGGCMLIYTHAYIAIYRTTPSSMAGTVGAIFNGALQLGSAIGLAAISSIETSVEATHGGPTLYTGRAMTYYFVLALVVVEAIALLVFYKVDAEKVGVDEEAMVEDLGVEVLEKEKEEVDSPVSSEGEYKEKEADMV